ncbi:MAG: 4-hydroxy-tetrahydrodipicolinate synthase [Planctomycetota bacterium]
MIQGSIVALVTPFRDGVVDYDALKGLVNFQIGEGTNGIAPCGTTGESATLSHREHEEVISAVIEAVDGRVPVYAGTGSNSTAEALSLTGFAKSAGAAAALMITPYYNKPTQEGLFAHYARVAERVDIPIILYNVPSRTGVSLSPETVARLSAIKNIVAIKEASGFMDQASHILSLCDITVLSGDDSLTLPLMALGAKGVVSVVANINPARVRGLVDAMLSGNLEEARRVHAELFPLCRAMFVETNPIPVKAAMRMLHRGNGEMRLPMVALRPENEEKLRLALRSAGLL